MNNWRYVILAVFVAMGIFLFSIWLPNLHFVQNVLFSQYFTASQKIAILLSSLGAYQTNFTVFGRIATLLIAVLFGINVSLVAFYFRQRFVLQKSAGMSLGGIVSGILGVGCASCGSVILSSILGVTTTTAFVTWLPLRGKEFSLIGIAMLTVSVIVTARKIKEPLVCK